MNHLQVLIDYFGNNNFKVIDLGCGVGLFLELCKQSSIAAIGYDGNSNAVEICLKKDLDAKHLMFENKIPEESESVNAVFCNQVIEHLTDVEQENLFNETFRILKPNGCVLLYSPCKYNEREQNKQGHINLITPSVLKDKMENAGFRVNLNLNYPLPDYKHKRSSFLINGSIDSISASAHAFAVKSSTSNSQATKK